MHRQRFYLILYLYLSSFAYYMVITKNSFAQQYFYRGASIYYAFSPLFSLPIYQLQLRKWKRRTRHKEKNSIPRDGKKKKQLVKPNYHPPIFSFDVSQTLTEIKPRNHCPRISLSHNFRSRKKQSYRCFHPSSLPPFANSAFRSTAKKRSFQKSKGNARSPGHVRPRHIHTVNFFFILCVAHTPFRSDVNRAENT